MNIKIYGCLGAASSVFYNVYVATSITRQGRSSITASIMLFESFLANNIKFGSLNQIVAFIDHVLQEKPNRKFRDSDILDNNVSKESVFAKLMLSCGYRWLPNDEDMEIIWRMVQRLDQEDLNRLYYKNNLYSFFDNEVPLEIVTDILKELDSPFIDPNSPPSNIQDKLDILVDIVKEYVYYRYQIIDKIERVETLIRQVDLTTDTDSCIITLNPWYTFIADKVRNEDMKIKHFDVDAVKLMEKENLNEAGDILKKDDSEFIYDFKNDEMSSILKTYIRFNKEEKEKPELTDLARAEFKKLEDGDQETYKLWEHIRKISLENYEKTYKLLNSKFDSYNGEAYYNDKMEPVVEELKEKGLLKESQGAQVVDLEKYNMPPCIIITSAGTTIYATRDLASLEDRMNTYNFDKAIYVVGNEQALHFKQVFKVFELMGYENYAKNCVHVPFGLVVDKDGEKIGSRKGNSVFLEDILNEAIDKVKDIINEKNPELEDKEEVARKVGVGAIIFNDLSNSRIKDEIFDWDMLLNFQGETGPYIQYIYVRTRSLLNKEGYMPKISTRHIKTYISI